MTHLEEQAAQTLAAVQKIKEVTEAEVATTLEHVRNAAAESGVSQHAHHFDDEARAYAKASTKWLGATIGLAALTILLAIGNFIWVEKMSATTTTAQAIQLSLSKFVLFALAYYGTVWSGKNYRVQRHNYVVNRHQRNALSSFETFVAASGDDETKNAVLVQATQSIFTPQASGFIGRDTESATTSPKILEMLVKQIPKGTG